MCSEYWDCHFSLLSLVVALCREYPPLWLLCDMSTQYCNFNCCELLMQLLPCAVSLGIAETVGCDSLALRLLCDFRTSHYNYCLLCPRSIWHCSYYVVQVLYTVVTCYHVLWAPGIVQNGLCHCSYFMWWGPGSLFIGCYK